MILLGIYQILRKKEKKYNYDTIIYIGLFGAILFYVIWEAAQRYSLSFLPWMIIPLGLIYAEITTKKKKSKEKSNETILAFLKAIKNHKSKIAKIGSISLMLLTFLLLAINFPKYTIEQQTYEDVRILSYRGFSDIEIGNNFIIQTFQTKASFNQIRIRFNNKNTDISSLYLFELLDKEGNVLVEEEFDSKKIKDGSNHKFNFAKIKPNKEEEYQIRISKIKGESVLKIGTYNESPYYKSYNNGKVFINE